MYERTDSGYDCVFVSKYALESKIKFKMLSNWFTMGA